MSIFDSLFGHKKEEQKEDKVNLTKKNRYSCISNRKLRVIK